MTDSEKKEWQYFEQTAIIGSHKQKTMYIDKCLCFRNTIPAPRFVAVQVWCFLLAPQKKQTKSVKLVEKVS